MTTFRSPDLERLASIEAMAQTAIDGLRSIIHTARQLAEGASGGIQRPLNAPPTPFSRPKPCSKIERRPELQALITARLADQTFDLIIAATAAHFPPEPRTFRSALCRWRQRKAAELADLNPQLSTPFGQFHQ